MELTLEAIMSCGSVSALRRKILASVTEGETSGEATVVRKSKADRLKAKKKKDKWAKTAGGRASAKKSKKHQDKVKSGAVKVDKKKSKQMKKVKQAYKNG